MVHGITQAPASTDARHCTTTNSQQQPLFWRLQVDAADSSSEELGLTLADVLRNDVLSALKTRHRSLSALM